MKALKKAARGKNSRPFSEDTVSIRTEGEEREEREGMEEGREEVLEGGVDVQPWETIVRENPKRWPPVFLILAGCCCKSVFKIIGKSHYQGQKRMQLLRCAIL